MTQLKLLAIGEVMAEIRQHAAHDLNQLNQGTTFAVGFAGDTFNTAVYAARALSRGKQGTQPASVGYLTRVGYDPLSEAFLKQAACEGIGTSAIVQDTERNIGVYCVATDQSGERRFYYWRTQSAARFMLREPADDLFIPDADILYLSGISLAILSPDARDRLWHVLRQKRQKTGCKIAFDSNYRPILWENQETARQEMKRFWDIVDIALPSIDDEMALYGDDSEASVIDRFGCRSWSGIAIKRGACGPIVPHLAPDTLPRFAPASRVVDTTAAGDSFNAGYLAAFLQGKDERACLLAGHTVAVQVVGISGAISPLQQDTD